MQGKGRHRRGETKDVGWGVVLGRQGEGGVQAVLLLPLTVLTVCLHRLLTDGGKGETGAKRLSPRAGRAGGECFVARVCMGRGQQLVVWLLGLLGARSPGNHGWGRGGVVGAVGRESGRGVSPHPPPRASHALVPVPAETATPPPPFLAASSTFPPRVPPVHPSLGTGLGGGSGDQH